MLGAILSIGAIPALIPIIIIIILIAAAAGLVRGKDLFALFGIGTLIGLSSGIGRGSTGKGLVGRSYGKGRGGRGFYVGLGGKMLSPNTKSMARSGAKNIKNTLMAPITKKQYVTTRIKQMDDYQNYYTTPSGVIGNSVDHYIKGEADKKVAQDAVQSSLSGKVKMSVASKPGRRTPIQKVVDYPKRRVENNASRLSFAFGGPLGLAGLIAYRNHKNPSSLKTLYKGSKKSVKELKKNNPSDYEDYKKRAENEWGEMKASRKAEKAKIAQQKKEAAEAAQKKGALNYFNYMAAQGKPQLVYAAAYTAISAIYKNGKKFEDKLYDSGSNANASDSNVAAASNLGSRTQFTNTYRKFVSGIYAYEEKAMALNEQRYKEAPDIGKMLKENGEVSVQDLMDYKSSKKKGLQAYYNWLAQHNSYYEEQEKKRL
ncbi:MAG: hypothetical protein ACP5SJ_00400 [Candidatus Micrarchaeia archaeon]